MRKSILTIVLCSIILMAGSIPTIAAEVQPSEIVESIESVAPHMMHITRAEMHPLFVKLKGLRVMLLVQ